MKRFISWESVTITLLFRCCIDNCVRFSCTASHAENQPLFDQTINENVSSYFSTQIGTGECSQLPFIDNGHVGYMASGFMPGDVAPVTCADGFHIMPRNAKPLLKCMNDGSWKPLDDSVELMCKAVTKCPWPTAIIHGSVQVLSSDGAVINSDLAISGSQAVYSCDAGYLIANGSAVLTCVDGVWEEDLPTCQLKRATDQCLRPPAFSHAEPYLGNRSLLQDGDSSFSHGISIIYVCDYGFVQQGLSSMKCVMGEWIGQGPKCLPQEKYCNYFPPRLVHGDYSFHGKDVFTSRKLFPPGMRVFYYCNNGYRLKDMNFSVLTCQDGTWTGNLTICVKRTNCDPPVDIENGNWVIESVYPDFPIGVTVSYECDYGYKAVGVTEIVCQASGYWSDYGPRCLPLDLYCAEPEPPVNGFFMCKPSHCNFFRVGTEIHFSCNKNFEPQTLSNSLVQTCLPGGVWSGEKPLCLSSVASYLSNFATTNTYSLDDNSFTVVVSTACGILGLLISVMTVVIIKRRHRRRHRRHPSPPDPSSHLDYSSPHSDDHEALIPYDDFASNTAAHALPTYEESMSTNMSSSCSSDQVSRSLFTRPSHEFRSPGVSRALGAIVSLPQDQAAPLESGLHRNSVTTVASSIMRTDNGSIIFGSVDTVNVSNATSTLAAVDTCDSMASNPSIAISHCAAAGSIDSSFASDLPSSDGDKVFTTCSTRNGLFT